MDKDVKDILDKYSRKLGGEIKSFDDKLISREYETFSEEEYLGELSLYEKLCNFSERLIKILPNKKDVKKLEDSIKLCHLRISPIGASSFSILALLFFVFLGILSAAITFLFFEINLFLILFFFIAGLIAFVIFKGYPNYLSNKWRLKASSQMVLCTLYVVMYMRHTSNLEHGVRFAANHITGPLSFDLKKVFWDIETGRFTNVKESLDNYLEIWRGYNDEFIEAFHLIESSLYEPSEDRRLDLLDKALDVMLENTYERMLHYAHDLKGPITILHMLGVILPILGLVIFPLVGSFLGGLVKWWHLAILYNIFLPLLVYFFGNNLINKRPTGYGESEISKELDNKRISHVEFSFFKKKFYVDPFWFGAFIGGAIFFVAIIPLIFHYLNPSNAFINDFLGYDCANNICVGPFSNYALMFSFLIPIALMFSFGLYYRLRTKKAILIKNYTRKLEKEFSSALFQLGNRVGDGLPVEVAISKVGSNMPDSPSGRFFNLVNNNITVHGMDLEEAIFDKKRGAINYFPSSVIESSMKVLVESAHKSPLVVSRAMTSISGYINQVHKIEERLKDLLADILSSMQSQILFLAPAIAGIVVGIGTLVANVLRKLSATLATGVGGGETGFGNIDVSSLPFTLKDAIAPYFFQMVIGIYLVQLIIILTILSRKIQSGEDKLEVEYAIGQNLFRGVILYLIISFIVILVFSGLSSVIVGGGF